MSRITTRTIINHLLTGKQIKSDDTETLGDDVCIFDTINLTTTPVALSFSEIISLGQISVKVESDTANPGAQDDVLISLDGGSTYPLRITEGDLQRLRLNSEGKLETSTVQTVADTSASLDGTYFTLEGNSGTWAPWIDVDNSGTAEPAHGADSSVEITSIATDGTAAENAAAIYADLIANSAFMADFDVAYDAATDLITITDKHTGTRTDIADGAGGAATGFTLATTQQGAADTSIYIKSVGTSIATIFAVPR